MILLDLKQGSPEWHRARLGIPTASQFARILTPTGKPSSAAERYLHELIAERLLGEQVVDYESDEMHRGTELESQAVAWYELQRDVDAQRAGFCLTDDRLCGCSPDRLIGEDGGLEIKCPSAAVHVGYLLDSVGAKFTPQVQGCLWITGRQWWDLVSFNPLLPSSVPAWQVQASKLSHALQYLCLILMPLSGFSASQFTKYGVTYFGLFKIPPMGWEDKVIYDFLHGIHGVTAGLLITLVLIHVAAALKHLLFDRDRVFLRMLPGK